MWAPQVESPVRHLSQPTALRQVSCDLTPSQAISFHNFHQISHDPGYHGLAGRVKACVLHIYPNVSLRWCHKGELRTKLEREHVFVRILLAVAVLSRGTDVGQQVFESSPEVLHRCEHLLLVGNTNGLFITLGAVLTLLFWGQPIGGRRITEG